MLYEATIAFLSLMLFTWAAAIWASNREEEEEKEEGEKTSFSEEQYTRSVA